MRQRDALAERAGEHRFAVLDFKLDSNRLQPNLVRVNIWAPFCSTQTKSVSLTAAGRPQS
jgi:hypothetical protein